MNPIQVLQYIASGALGKSAFQGGLATAALGAAFHFTIAWAAAAVFVLVSRPLQVLKKHAVPGGLLYGAAVYFFMNYLVLPLSAVAAGTFQLGLFLNGAIGHAVLVGLQSPFLLGGHNDPTNVKVATVVLVHAAWADASSWNKVIPPLHRKRMRVVAVQIPLTSLSEDVVTVRRTLQRVSGPVVLVGHSYAGAVITAAAMDNSQVKALIYVAVIVPDEAETVGALFHEAEPDGGVRPPIAPDASRKPRSV